MILSTFCLAAFFNDEDNDSYYCHEDDKHCLAEMVLGNSDLYVQGEAIVSSSASEDCPKTDHGKTRTARVYPSKKPCTHAYCTSAKHEAANRLRSNVPEACRKYVRETGSCKYGPGCR